MDGLAWKCDKDQATSTATYTGVEKNIFRGLHAWLRYIEKGYLVLYFSIYLKNPAIHKIIMKNTGLDLNK